MRSIKSHVFPVLSTVGHVRISSSLIFQLSGKEMCGTKFNLLYILHLRPISFSFSGQQVLLLFCGCDGLVDQM